MHQAQEEFQKSYGSGFAYSAAGPPQDYLERFHLCVGPQREVRLCSGCLCLTGLLLSEKQEPLGRAPTYNPWMPFGLVMEEANRIVREHAEQLFDTYLRGAPLL